jgi:hypothetical protein
MHKKSNWKQAVIHSEFLNFCWLQTNKGKKRLAGIWQSELS